MTLDDMEPTLSAASPPSDWSLPAQALWWDRKGDWSRAHELVNADPSKSAALVHAYLHRREGDIANAAYWYRRAGEPQASDSLEEEWRRLLARATERR